MEMIAFTITTVSLLSATSVFRSLRPFHTITRIHTPIHVPMATTGIRMAVTDPSMVALNEEFGVTKEYRS